MRHTVIPCVPNWDILERMYQLRLRAGFPLTVSQASYHYSTQPAFFHSSTHIIRTPCISSGIITGIYLISCVSFIIICAFWIRNIY